MDMILLTKVVILVVLIIGVLQIIYPHKMIIFGINWIFKGKEDIGVSINLITRIQGVIIVGISIFALLKMINI